MKVIFSNGTQKECKAINVRSFSVNQITREGVDILFDAGEDLNSLRELNQNEDALRSIQIHSEENGATETYSGYLVPMGVGIDLFDYYDTATNALSSGMCAYFSACQQSDLEMLQPQIDIAVAALDDETAKSCADLYPEWSGAEASYNKNDRVKEHHTLYKCLKSHVSQPSWSPSQAASLWVNIGDPSEEYPLIDNPIKSTNPWMQGQKGRTADGRKWVSLIDNNVWQPDDYAAGWQQAE